MSEPETTVDVVKICIPSRLEMLNLLDCVSSALCERMEFDNDVCSMITMSVIEAGTNAIQHGHGKDASKIVDVRFDLYEDRIEISVFDRGPGFDPDSINGDITTPDRLLDPRGRGIFIMKSCMDSVDFEFTKTGTLCRLIKRRPETSSRV